MANVKFLPDNLNPTNRGKVALSIKETDAGLVAFITHGHPFFDDKQVRILAVKEVPSKQAAKEWFARQLKLRPWETRQ